MHEHTEHQPATAMTNRADVVESGSGPPANGSSARERALRFNRGVIGLCVVTLLVMMLLPV